MSSPILSRPRFHERIGLLIAGPKRGLGLVVEHKSGGVRDALLLVGLSVLAFRVPDLVRAFAAMGRVSLSSGLSQLLGVLGSEVRIAAGVALLAALAIVIFAGRGRRDPSLALELGSACYVPYVIAWTPFRILDLEAVWGYLPQPLILVARLLAWAWVIALVILSVWLVHRSEETAAPARPTPTLARLAGFAALAALATAFVLSAAWSARNYQVLRPLGRSDQAPDFALVRVDGRPGDLRLSDLRGRVVLLDFWATWCPPCVAMMPVLHDLYGEWRTHGVEFVGINAEGAGATNDDIRGFLARHPFPYPVVFDDRGVGGMFGVTSLPHLVIVGRDGRVSRVFVGSVGRRQLAAALDAASQSGPIGSPIGSTIGP